MSENIKRLIETEKKMKGKIDAARESLANMLKDARKDAKEELSYLENEYLEKLEKKQLKFDERLKNVENEINEEAIEKEKNIFRSFNEEEIQKMLKSKPYEENVGCKEIDDIVTEMVKIVTMK